MTANSLLNFTPDSMFRHRPSRPLPPLEQTSKSVLSVVLDFRHIEIKYGVELSIETRVIRTNCSIQFILYPSLNTMGWVSGIPPQIKIPFSGITVLQVTRIPVTAETGAKQIHVIELPPRIAYLAPPMLDLHGSLIVSDTSGAIAAKSSLLCSQRRTQIIFS